MENKTVYENVYISNETSFLIRYDEVRPQDEIEYHVHKEYEIQYVISGTGKHIIDGITEDITEGELIVAPAGIPHGWIYDIPKDADEDYRIKECCIQFPLSLVLEKMGQFPELQKYGEFLSNQNKGIELSGAGADQIRSIMISMINQDNVDRFISLIRILKTMYSETQFRVISLELSDQFHQDPHQRIQKILAYMASHLSEQLTLDGVASYMGMNKSAFCNYFKSHSGRTFTYALNEMRIHKAATLLGNFPSESIASIAYSVGYQAVSHFNHEFRKIKGCSPSKYRLIKK